MGQPAGRWSLRPNLMETVMQTHCGRILKMIAPLAAAIMLLLTAGAGAPAFAIGTTYTNAALLGCYSHRIVSVDTQTAANNTAQVGTFCFDGAGTLVYTPSNLTGGCSNVNGAWNCPGVGPHSGTYTVTNSPGDGMGTFSIYVGTSLCEVHEFSLNSVDTNGLAHGFDFILLQAYPYPHCANPLAKAKVKSGVATYQGP